MSATRDAGKLRTGWVLALVFALCHVAAATDRSALTVVEGEVLRVGRLAGEGDLELVTVRVSGERVPGGELELLLAPEAVLEEVGFSVLAGDRLKARVFATEEGPARVHKVRNLSRSSMVRLRTLRQIPLWDGLGAWQGSPGLGGAGMGQKGGERRGPPTSPRGGGPGR